MYVLGNMNIFGYCILINHLLSSHRCIRLPLRSNSITRIFLTCHLRVHIHTRYIGNVLKCLQRGGIPASVGEEGRCCCCWRRWDKPAAVLRHVRNLVRSRCHQTRDRSSCCLVWRFANDYTALYIICLLLDITLGWLFLVG